MLCVQVPDKGLFATKYACDMPHIYVQRLARDLNLALKTYIH